MRILRTGETRTCGKLLDCKIYVRKNFTVIGAAEWYYKFVGENSYLPICDLLCPEDAEILKTAIEDLTEPVEVVTQIINGRDEGYRNVYLRLENCDQTEEGKPVYQITLLDILDLEGRTAYMEQRLAKYRHFMTLKDEYYFEYTLHDNRFVVYKYINEKAMCVLDSDLDAFAAEHEQSRTKEQMEQMRTFCTYLKSRSHSFEMKFTMIQQDEKASCCVKGGTYYKNKDMVAGIFIPNQNAADEAYYLTSAAKDPGTGLFNKKAATEYAIEKLQAADNKLRWLLIMDIDDFKNINDSFGHLFGDQVIRKVADILQVNIGHRGIVGRFGGDEFLVLLEEVGTREELKILLKTIVKQFALAFDPKVKVTTSIGVCQYPQDGTAFEELFGKADKALYIAKRKGKSRHIIYEESLHGAYTKDSMKSQAVAYAVSREKRRKALIDVMSNMYVKGAGYVTERAEVQKNIRDLFDLDGLTIYSDYGRTVLCRNGNYIVPFPKGHEGLMSEAYLSLFGDEDVLVETTTQRHKTQTPEAYQAAIKQEIGASIQCIARKDGVPFVMVHFDIFNRVRKWSDMDIEMLSLIGCCMCRMICEEK